ncbi:shikimate kinase [Dehalogenimonas sp. THU2]|uniref:shikimate kinase n=1 Tax=Dehalogenimonas sp. THU2 TaxID=3151121 RepID=UPI003218BAFE
MKRNIALIGFMGSGKSSAGKRMARRLGYEFVEIDRLIEQQAGKSVAQIFAELGEPGFRDLEEEIINKVSVSARGAVIACGGGVVQRPVNIDRLRNSSHIVYLETDTASLQDRLSNSRNRPLLEHPDRDRIIADLHTARRPLYEAAADITVKTGGRPFAAVINEIIEKLGIDESQHQ